MRRILFDEQIFRRQNYGGISRYFTELITGIATRPGYKVLPQKFISDNIYLATNNLNRFDWLKKADFTGKGFIEKFVLKTEAYTNAERIRQGKFDVFHPTYYNDAFLKYIPQNKPFILTVHDMIHESYFDKMHEYLSDETKQKFALVPKAHHIIAVSEYTKNQVLKFFPQIGADKISVIHHGTNLQPRIAVKKPSHLPEKYLLYVGLKKHYKRFFWLADALADYLKQKEVILLCAGGFDFDAYESNFLSSAGLEQHVKYVAIRSDEELAAIYKNAECFIFPSVAEGFGMPILEAFACECPVLLSDSSCFPEIAGDAALYFELGNKEDLLQKVDTILKDNIVSSSLVKKGIARAKLFTWEKSVQQHLEVYDAI